MQGKNIGCAIYGGEKLSGYLDGMLDGETLRRTNAHLEACDSCRAELRMLEQTRDAIHAIEQPAQPGPEFWANAYRRARVENAATSRTGWSMRVPVAMRVRILASSATFAALIVGAIYLNTPLTPPFNAAPISDSVDVSTLVRSHADYVSYKSVADSSHNRIVRSDIVESTSGADVSMIADLSDPSAVANAVSD